MEMKGLKKCKYLDSLLDGESDIKRRKGLTIDSFNIQSKRINTVIEFNNFILKMWFLS